MQKALLIILLMTLAVISHAQKIRVVGNSKIARLVARINGDDSYAITFGKTIFVSCKKEDFFAKRWWVRHELVHVAQYEKEGVFHFLSLYLYYAAFHHKSENPFEAEAEAAE